MGNLISCWNLGPQADHNVLEQALNDLVEEYDVFSRVYLDVDTAGSVKDARLRLVDLGSAASIDEAANDLKNFLETDYDIDAGCYSRAAIISSRTGGQLFGLAVAHMIADEISLNMIIDSLQEFYSYRAENATVSLKTRPSYAAFCRMQREALASSWGSASRKYWIDYVNTWGSYPPRTNPWSRKPGATSSESSVISLVEVLDESETEALRRRRKIARVTGFVSAAGFLFEAMAHAEAGCSEGELGLVTNTHGRNRIAYTKTVGLFAHGIPLHAPRRTHGASSSDLYLSELQARLIDSVQWGIPLRPAAKIWEATNSAPISRGDTATIVLSYGAGHNPRHLRLGAFTYPPHDLYHFREQRLSPGGTAFVLVDELSDKVEVTFRIDSTIFSEGQVRTSLERARHLLREEAS